MLSTIKKIPLIICCFIATVNLSAQDESFKEKFLEANTLIEEKLYNVALPIWLDLQKEQPVNNNLNYKIGLCYMKSVNQKAKALDYLVSASKSVTKNYDPFSHLEKKAPVEVYFYLARAQHLNYKLNEATSNYDSFKDQISIKHYLFTAVDHNKEQCENAKIAVANPVNTKITNMGNGVNSVYGDYSPAISVDESTIYFTSRRLRKDSSNLYIKDVATDKFYEDIYVSHNYKGNWSEPKVLNINSDGHEAVINISTDGQTLFLYKDDNGDGNIYTSQLTNTGEWSALTTLGSEINSTSQETHAHISPDGKSLYFVSDRSEGSNGGKDIYVCTKLPSGEWSVAQNIGTNVNTPYDEDGIFIHPDGKTMYFSSNGHNSIGGYDIFYSTMDKDGTWSKPINMGYPINSTDNDLFFVTSPDGKRGYYSSFQKGGMGEKDIYQISLEDETKKAITLLTGFIKIYGYDTLPANGTLTITKDKSNAQAKIYKPRKKDGKFGVVLQPGNKYHILYAAGEYTKEEDLSIPSTSSYQKIERNIIFGKPENFPVSGKDRIEKLKAAIAKLELKNSEDWNFHNKDELDKLKTALASLKLINDSDWSKLQEARLDEIEDRINKLKASGAVIASYQEYFNYNINSINTAHNKFINVIEKILKEKGKSEKIIIDIESSASHVPTKTFGTNKNLAQKRAEAAKNVIITSLANKGIKKGNIIINKLSANINGPKYNNDYQNKGAYEKHQYVIIKIR